jgi:hypothetical protein
MRKSQERAMALVGNERWSMVSDNINVAGDESCTCESSSTFINVHQRSSTFIDVHRSSIIDVHRSSASG